MFIKRIPFSLRQFKLLGLITFSIILQIRWSFNHMYQVIVQVLKKALI